MKDNFKNYNDFYILNLHNRLFMKISHILSHLRIEMKWFTVHVGPFFSFFTFYFLLHTERADLDKNQQIITTTLYCPKILIIIVIINSIFQLKNYSNTWTKINVYSLLS